MEWLAGPDKYGRISSYSLATTEDGASWTKHIGLYHELETLIPTLFGDESWLITGTYLCSDIGQLLHWYPHHAPVIWRALKACRVVGIDICQLLLDIRDGELEEDKEAFYSLAGLARKYRHEMPEKDNGWCTQFDSLREIPPDQWPESARRYVLDDAEVPGKILLQMLQGDARGLHRAGIETAHQVWLYQTANEGVHVDGARLAASEKIVDEYRESIVDSLTLTRVATADGQVHEFQDPKAAAAFQAETRDSELWPALVRVDKKGKRTKDKKATQLAVCRAFEAMGKVPALADAGDALEKAGLLAAEDRWKYVSTNKDQCQLSTDPLLVTYTEYLTCTGGGVGGRLKDLRAAYEAGSKVYTNLAPLVSTGRTSSRKDSKDHADRRHSVQQQNWHRGTVSWGAKKINLRLREIMTPPPGYVFVWFDFSAAEMHTLAQSCKDLVGYSKLGELLNHHVDPHAWFGGIAFEGLYAPDGVYGIEADKWIADYVMKSPRKKVVRDSAKPVNFGLPGGMGPDKWIVFARVQYDKHFDRPTAVRLRGQWFSCLPEVKEMQGYTNSLLGGRDGCEIVLPRGGIIGGGKRYTAANNFWFQAPTAAGAKAAMLECAAQCQEPGAPLYGWKPWNFVHDEGCFIAPADPEIVDAGARELVRVCEPAFNYYCPDYPTHIEVSAGNVWTKDDAAGYKIGSKKIWHYAT
jgi:hypothetical protein